ncbi:hypothetical protein H9P43_000481 [Blastocladiella emersonii ATCC 22665]|nr:hypothetical protein H9P43_000481 [Blastocladiella emersonii ATCC 22665]
MPSRRRRDGKKKKKADTAAAAAAMADVDGYLAMQGRVFHGASTPGLIRVQGNPDGALSTSAVLISSAGLEQAYTAVQPVLHQSGHLVIHGGGPRQLSSSLLAAATGADNGAVRLGPEISLNGDPSSSKSAGGLRYAKFLAGRLDDSAGSTLRSSGNSDRPSKLKRKT